MWHSNIKGQISTMQSPTIIICLYLQANRNDHIILTDVGMGKTSTISLLGGIQWTFQREKQLHRLRIEIHGYEKKNGLGREESAVHVNLKLRFIKQSTKDRYGTRNSIQKKKRCDMSTGIDKLTDGEQVQ